MRMVLLKTYHFLVFINEKVGDSFMVILALLEK